MKTHSLIASNPMVSTPTSLRPGIKALVQETLLTPRFYTTDFQALAAMDVSDHTDELQAVVAELQADYNRYHFVRDEDFEHAWNLVDEDTRRSFIDFLERSCTSEFSGFLLFKELSRQLKTCNPILAEAFHLMARDEARHAGFLNKAMSDLGVSLDLGYLTKERSYTFFPPAWIIYTVYLSEKIGYWRYIIAYRHVQAHPEYAISPLFRYFERWCQDENRHGDFFKALLHSQPRLWNNWGARLWMRFFLLTVFATHTMTVLERASFYEAIGLNPRTYNEDVIRHTNETAKRAFAVVLNTGHPEFFLRLEACYTLSQRLAALKASPRPAVLKSLGQIPLILGILGHLVRLYLLPPIRTESQWHTPASPGQSQVWGSSKAAKLLP